MIKTLLLFVVFWNLENFFDYFDGGYSDSDKEFSSFGDKHWTKSKFLRKCSLIAESTFYIAGSHGDEMPQIIALAEVENRWVLQKLIEETLLYKYDYKIVHYESPDPRGIDVALLYRNLELTSSCPVRIDSFATRDILFAGFVTDGGDSLAVFVNHHPSKYSGRTSDCKRGTAVRRLMEASDSVLALGWTRQLMLGDFNDVPDSKVNDNLNARYHNLALPLWKEKQGSIRYNGCWELIDQAYVTSDLAPYAAMAIEKIPFLMVRDKTYPGEKPLRTYSGPGYLGGVSDHCPITVTIATCTP